MSDMTDIRIGSNDVILKDNRVKSSIIPTGTKELKRNVTVQGNVEIDGAVYADKLQVESGPTRFAKSVFAESEIYVLATSKNTVLFTKAVGSSDRISALVNSGRVVFGSDVNAPKVSLKNCFVAGSIFAETVTLENSVVLGGVFASKNLTIKNSIVGLFNSSHVKAEGINYMLYPTSFSVDRIEQTPGTSFNNISLAELGSLFKGEASKPNTGRIEMNLQEDAQYMNLSDKDGNQYVVNSYSVAARIIVADLVNFEKMENHFLITAASLGPQLLKSYSLIKEDGSASDPLNLAHIVPFFFNILSGKIDIPVLDAHVSFEELKSKIMKE